MCAIKLFFDGHICRLLCKIVRVCVCVCWRAAEAQFHRCSKNFFMWHHCEVPIKHNATVPCVYVVYTYGWCSLRLRMLRGAHTIAMRPSMYVRTYIWIDIVVGCHMYACIHRHTDPNSHTQAHETRCVLVHHTPVPCIATTVRAHDEKADQKSTRYIWYLRFFNFK